MAFDRRWTPLAAVVIVTQAQVRALYPGDLCVHRVGRTAADLEQPARRTAVAMARLTLADPNGGP